MWQFLKLLRPPRYPHYKDELTKLKFIGSITAQRLRDIQAHINADVPFTSIDTGQFVGAVLVRRTMRRVAHTLAFCT